MSSKSEKSLRRTKSLESSSSSSTFIVNGQTPSLTPEGLYPTEESLYDIISYILYCEKHENIAVSKNDRASWLPFVYYHPELTYQDAADDGVALILNVTTNKELIKTTYIQLLRFQIPQSFRFIIKLTYFFKIKKNFSPDKNWKCCRSTKKIKWISFEDIATQNAQKLDFIWGPELVQFSRLVVDSESDSLKSDIVEFTSDYALAFVPRESPRNIEEATLKSLSITEKEVENVYVQFLEQCFPSYYMTFASFIDFFGKLGIYLTNEISLRLFNAFNYNKNGYLSFHEFLLGIACYEAVALHDESRVKFVFRYYDTDSDGHLSVDEMFKMMIDIHQNDDEKTLAAKTKDAMKAIGTENTKVSFAKFMNAVRERKFRGTSTLIRSDVALFSQMSLKRAQKSIHKHDTKGLSAIQATRKYKGVCPGCKAKKYKLATNVIKVDPLNNMTFEVINDAELKSLSLPEVETIKKHSKDIVFNKQSLANYVLNMLRKFNTIKGTYLNPLGIGSIPSEREKFVTIVTQICSEVEKIFADEDRVVKVSSPAFVIGDIHGNIEDLLVFEKMLWPLFPIVTANYVFLGDYVDRGKWGVECALYIFTLKILAPDKFFFCRGNHEIREIQSLFTFQKECFNKYGNDYGKKVFELLNRVFDRMPLAIIIDDTIFCCHGGIPTSCKKVQDLLKIPVELKNPEIQSPPAWEIMWNDPIPSQEFNPIAQMTNIRLESAKGFQSNIKRGTAYYFNELAADSFNIIIIIILHTINF